MFALIVLTAVMAFIGLSTLIVVANTGKERETITPELASHVVFLASALIIPMVCVYVVDHVQEAPLFRQLALIYTPALMLWSTVEVIQKIGKPLKPITPNNTLGVLVLNAASIGSLIYFLASR